MKRHPVVLIAVLALVCVIGAAAASTAAAAAYRALRPGQTRILSQTLPVNIVFVGYEPGSGAQQVDEAAFLADLPSSHRPQEAFWLFDDGPQQLRFTYDYNTVWVDDVFEDDFFGFLSRIAVDKPLTSFQEAYNAQSNATGEVTDSCWIDAPRVERWLKNHAAAVGVDSRQYTIFFVNWHGRDDFRFHVYSKTNEPDPDTGVNLGEFADYTKVIAWGGTPKDDPQNPSRKLGRVWFCDLSAGPDGFTGSWNVDDPRVDPYWPGVLDEGEEQYRIPPIWEYGNTAGYRPFDDLTGDLGRLAGEVAVKGMFTSDCLDSSLSDVRIPRRVEIAFSLFDIEPSVNGRDFFKAKWIVKRLRKLQPWREFSWNFKHYGPEDELSVELKDAVGSWLDWWYSDRTDASGSLYPDDPDNDTPHGDLLPFLRRHLPMLVDSGGGAYQIPQIEMSLPDDLAAYVFGLEGLDPNTLRPFSFNFTTALEREEIGYGLSATTLHEVGHCLGLDHPHDFLTGDERVVANPQGAYFYKWAGAQSNSMMSYIDLNWDFGQFDYDTTARVMTVTYWNHSNQVAGRILESGRARMVSSLLKKADSRMVLALRAYRQMEYRTAAGRASQAYALVMKAAQRIRSKYGRAAVPLGASERTTDVVGGVSGVGGLRAGARVR